MATAEAPSTALEKQQSQGINAPGTVINTTTGVNNRYGNGTLLGEMGI
jgi:hypothetical protein